MLESRSNVELETVMFKMALTAWYGNAMSKIFQKLY